MQQEEVLQQTMSNIMSNISEICNELLKTLEPLLEIHKTTPPPCEIKRRLKYTKNPMEVKKLNQQLTVAYRVYGKRKERKTENKNYRGDKNAN